MSRTPGRPAKDASGPTTSTQEAIKQAASELFARDGYAATSLRQIARAADVDPALVIRHFGSKEALFVQTVPEGGPFDQVLDGPLDGFGERIVAFVFDGLDHSRFDVFVDVLRSASTEAIRHLQADMMEASFSKLAKQLPGPDAKLRSRLVAAQVAGLLMAVRGSEMALSPGERRAAIQIYGAAIQSMVEWRRPAGRRSTR